MRYVCLLLIFCFVFNVLYYELSSADEPREHLIAGVYNLINRGDSEKAERHFQRVILLSSYNSLLNEPAEFSELGTASYEIVAQAFYFLGKIYYDRSAGNSELDRYISKAKAYFNKAEEYGIVYDKLHPPLLKEINEKYPEIPSSNLESQASKAKAVIEIDNGIYKIDSVQVNRDLNITNKRFSTNKELSLQGGAVYKMKPDIKGSYNLLYRTMAIFGIGLMIWFVRD